MLSPYDITYDLTTLPAPVQALIATIDADLAAPWQPGARERTLQYQWSAVGGFTQAKLNAVGRVLHAYHTRGWDTHFGDPQNQTTLRLVFALPGI